MSTRVRVKAPAIETYIDVLQSEGAYLATSPEIEMKRLLAQGSGSIFQIAHVFRKGEVGPRHREEFHLLEWYRVGDAEACFEQLKRDVEVIVERLAEFVATKLDVSTSVQLLGAGQTWERRAFDELYVETTGRSFPTTAEEVEAEIERVSEGQGTALTRPNAGGDEQLRELEAWTSLFSWWSDRCLDPWLGERGGVHVHDFPAALAALAQTKPHPDGSGRACRFESYVAGVELANGYLELRDEAQQRVRFERANAQRALHGLGALPVSDPFCEAVGQLPPCAGIAVGLERLLCTLVGTTQLADILVLDDAHRDL